MSRVQTEHPVHWPANRLQVTKSSVTFHPETQRTFGAFCCKCIIFSIYTRHLLHVCPSWERDPSSVALPEVSPIFPFKLWVFSGSFSLYDVRVYDYIIFYLRVYKLFFISSFVFSYITMLHFFGGARVIRFSLPFLHCSFCAYDIRTLELNWIWRMSSSLQKRPFPYIYCYSNGKNSNHRK